MDGVGCGLRIGSPIRGLIRDREEKRSEEEKQPSSETHLESPRSVLGAKDPRFLVFAVVVGPVKACSFAHGDQRKGELQFVCSVGKI
jgi:hypothetical protein